MNNTVRAGSSVQVRVATSLEALEEHADSWDRLALASPERLPMLSHAWVASFLETCNPEGSPWACLFAYAGEDLIGVLPLLRRRRFGFSRLVGPVDNHTDFAHPLLSTDRAVEALEALVDAAGELYPGLWMRFYGIRDSSPLLPALPALEPRYRILRPTVDDGSFVDTSGSFEAYQTELSSSFRRSLRSARRKAEQEHVLDFEVVAGAEAARTDLLADFIRVEAAGWKGQSGSAIACDPARVAFYTALAQRLANRGWLEWNLARFDGTVVAAHFGVRLGSSLLLPKGGFDETFIRFAPGNLLFWEVFTRSFENDTEEVNFLTGKPWMRIWKMHSSRYHSIIATPRHHPVAAAGSVLAAAELRRHASEYAEQHQPWMRELVQKTRTWRHGRPRSGTP